MISQEMIKKIEDVVELQHYTSDITDTVNNSIYDELIEDGEAINLSRNQIDLDYISYVMNEEDIQGKILISNNTKVGMMFYKFNDIHVELKIIGTMPNEETDGLQLGRYLLYILEKEAYNKGFRLLTAYVLPQIVNWYMINDWYETSENGNGDKDRETIPMEKVLVEYQTTEPFNFEKQYVIDILEETYINIEEEEEKESFNLFKTLRQMFNIF